MSRRGNVLAAVFAPIWVPFFLALLAGQIAVDLASDILCTSRTRFPPKV